MNKKTKEMDKYKNITDFEQLIEVEYGKIGTERRNKYEENAQMFIISEITGTKKSYISKLVNAKGNIQLSTLIRIFEQGLNKRIGLTFL